MSAEELRSLDAWIAEHVMGMKPISKDGPRPTDGTEADYFVREWIHASESLPHYTTNDADAMAVLKVCAIKCTVLITGTKAGEWIVSGAGIGAEAPTLPEAICIFAKKLHGG